MTKKSPSEVEKELFQMVYDWGRVGVVCDENCYAFQETIKDLLKAHLVKSKSKK